MSRVDILPAKGENIREVFLSLPGPGRGAFPLCVFGVEEKAPGLQSPCGFPGESHDCKAEAPPKGGWEAPRRQIPRLPGSRPPLAPALGLLAREARSDSPPPENSHRGLKVLETGHLERRDER